MRDPNSPRLGLTEIARHLGVKPNQVFMWYCRRDRNGFPEPVGKRPRGANGRPGNVWDWDQVRAWHSNYVPDKGGNPNWIKLGEE